MTTKPLGPITIDNPTPEDLAAIGARYKGRGSAGDEWCIGYMRPELDGPREAVRWYSGVGSEVYALCKRLQGNPAACWKVRDVGDGVFFDLDPAEVKAPALLVQGTPAAERSARAAKRLGKSGRAS